MFFNLQCAHFARRFCAAMQKLSSVLLVDDDPTTNYINELLLTKQGVTDRVLVAQNGEEALTLLAQTCAAGASTCPDLVLLDINMPVMGGIDFLEAFQPPFPAPSIVVIFLTTSLNPHDLARLNLLPHAGLLSKPLTRDKLADVLEQHFQRQLPAPVAPQLW